MAAGTDCAGDAETKARIFISYSRKDMDFATPPASSLNQPAAASASSRRGTEKSRPAASLITASG